MANAHTSSDRYIVCGVNGSGPNQRSWPGVPEAELTDAAVYQRTPVHDATAVHRST